MDDTSYAPVQDKGALLESGGFGGTTLGSNNSPNSNNMNSFSTSSNFDTSSYSPSSLPSHGFYNNSHSLWNKVTDIFEKPAAKLAAGITGLILLIVIKYNYTPSRRSLGPRHPYCHNRNGGLANRFCSIRMVSIFRN